jgi:hypothetical protein
VLLLVNKTYCFAPYTDMVLYVIYGDGGSFDGQLRLSPSIFFQVGGLVKGKL